MRFQVIGAGCAGSTVARVLADAGAHVEVLEQRNHIGGNSYDGFDSHGVRVHPYGPHVFHTNSEAVFAWLSRFTKWTPYTHRVLARVDDQLVPVPVNIRTIELIHGVSIAESDLTNFLDSVRVRFVRPRNAEEYLLATVGELICNKLFREYTRKQWGRDLSEMPVETVARIPLRLSADDRYFTDKYQCMPSDGYHRLFGEVLDHKNIDVKLNVKFRASCMSRKIDHVVFTGPLDEFFSHSHGRLPYRSVKFEMTHHRHVDYHQEVAVVNFPSRSVDYTRVTEFKHMTGQVLEGTTLMTEFPTSEGDAMYPVLGDASRGALRSYQRLASRLSSVTFVGRLGEYRYYDMDQAVAAGLRVGSALVCRFSRDCRIPTTVRDSTCSVVQKSDVSRT